MLEEVGRRFQIFLTSGHYNQQWTWLGAPM